MTVYIGDPALPNTRLCYIVQGNRLDPPRFSPKKFGTDDPQAYEFDWLTDGYAKDMSSTGQYNIRFRVYSQERKEAGDKAPMVTRQLLRLYDMVSHKYQI